MSTCRSEKQAKPGGAVKEIDRQTWARRDHFDVFRSFHYPHFAMCAEVDVTAVLNAVGAADISLTAAIVYVVSRAANDIPEFRQRIRGDTVVEHDVVHPSATILVDDDLFSFCAVDYTEDFESFAAAFAEGSAAVRRQPTLDDTGRDDELWMTAIPWISFTSFAHPIVSLPADSIPRFAWGKHHGDADRVQMPLSVQGHHALMDGLHVARYYQRVGHYFSHPETFLKPK